MTSASDFEIQLRSVLHNAAKKLELENYSLNLNLEAIKGDGFLGEFYKVSILDKDSDKEHHLAVKRAPTEALRREQDNIEALYTNEIYFYTHVYPALRKFEKDRKIQECFCSVPDFVTSCNETGREVLVLKDLTKMGFEIREKNLLLDDHHTRSIFKTYGHFHAISFCMKELEPENFEKLTKPLENFWMFWADNEAFTGMLNKIVDKVDESLDPIQDAQVIEKFQKYKRNSCEVFKNYGQYKGTHFGIIHGDCWSNNMMFKYQDQTKSKLADMNLIDFQLINVGSPVHDLSYFFYTGGSKQLFDKLEDYLDIYHASFCKAAINLGCDPRKLLPRKVLSEEWKQYSKFGMLLAFLLTKIKLISKEDTIEVIEQANNVKSVEEIDDGTKFMEVKYDKELFKKRVRDIVVHMYEINAL